MFFNQQLPHNVTESSTEEEIKQEIVRVDAETEEIKQEIERVDAETRELERNLRKAEATIRALQDLNRSMGGKVLPTILCTKKTRARSNCRSHTHALVKIAADATTKQLSSPKLQTLD